MNGFTLFFLENELYQPTNEINERKRFFLFVKKKRRLKKVNVKGNERKKSILFFALDNSLFFSYFRKKVEDNPQIQSSFQNIKF